MGRANSAPPRTHSTCGPELRKRPLSASAGALVAGLAWAHGGPPQLLGVVQVLLALCCIVGLLRGTRRGRAQALLLGVPVLLGLWVGSGSAFESRGDAPQNETQEVRPLLCEGQVVGPVRVLPARRGSGPALRFQFRIDSPSAMELQVRAPGEPGFARGDRLRLLGRWDPLGDTVQVRVPAHLQVIDKSHSWSAWADRWRWELRRSWQERCSPEVAAWLAALLLGDRSGLSTRTLERFRSVGLGHLLAISGLHVGILVALLLWLPKRLRWVSPRVRGACLALALFFYVGLAGGSAPVIRAAIFFAIGAVALWGRRRIALGHCLSLTFFVCVAGFPAAVHGIGFVLSFSAVLGIVWATRTQTRASAGRWFGIREALRVSCGAWCGASLAVVWWSPEIVPWGPLLTLVLLPVFSLFLGWGALSAVGVGWVPNAVWDVPLRLLLNFTEWVVELADRLPWTPLSLPPFPPSAWLLLSLALMTWRHPRCSIGGHGLVLSLAVVTIAAVPMSSGGALLPVGRGQCLVLWSARAVIVYDAGSLDSWDGGARVLRDRLRDLGRSHIDLLILSHPHLDHVNGVPGILRQLSIGTVAWGPRFEAEQLGELTAGFIRAAGVQSLVLSQGDRLQVADWSLEVLHPPRATMAELRTSTNDDSVALCIEELPQDGCTPLRVVALGDLETQGMQRTRSGLGRYAGAWVLLPHHGRYAPGLADWLRAGQWAGAIASAPARGMPNATQEVLDRLALPSAATRWRCAVEWRADLALWGRVELRR